MSERPIMQDGSQSNIEMQNMDPVFLRQQQIIYEDIQRQNSQTRPPRINQIRDSPPDQQARFETQEVVDPNHIDTLPEGDVSE